MPRTFNNAIQSEINKQYGGEPMYVVEISWNGLDLIAYTDRKLNGEDYPYPNLVSVGKFDTTTIVNGSGDSQSVDIVLSDLDGSIHEILDNFDCHLKPVRISLTYQGLPLAAKALLFEGLINSEMVWDESSRTFSFSVLSKLEDNEVGFTMEDGTFPNVPEGDRNKAWPLVFGQVCNMEAVQVTALRKGFLAEGVGVPDPTIDERLCQAYKLTCPISKVNNTSTAGGGTDANGDTEAGGGGTVFISTPGGGGTGQAISYTSQVIRITGGVETIITKRFDDPDNVRTGQPDPQCLSRRFNEICTILAEKAQQEQYVVNPFTVRGGDEFPQNKKINIKIGEVIFTGRMSGEEFTVSNVHHPQEDTIDNPPCKDIGAAGLGYRYKPGADQFPTTTEECDAGGNSFTKDVQNGDGESWRYYHTFEAGDFIWLPPGTDVYLEDESELLHIVSLIPGTVDQVAAYRTYGDTTLLTEVDPSRYTVVTSDFGDYDVVEVRLSSKLSKIPDQKWDDKLYVSFTSDVGPNPVDIIEWLLNKYTDYSKDATSFADVKSKMTKYPTNFFLKSRPSVLDVIRDIAFQTRCAVYVRDGIMYITYLSEEPSSLLTLTESDILSGTFKFRHTKTEDLETRHLISWSDGEAGVNQEDPTDFEFVLKHNIPKYGIFPASYDYYTQNTFSTIEKSATFWMIRNSNTWRYVEFELPVKYLNIDVFDCVTLNISQFPTTKIVIEETDYQADTNSVLIKAWTPILSGTNEQAYWAWPASQILQSKWPLPGDEDQSGDGLSLTVIPPSGHPLRGGFNPLAVLKATDGDTNPSDTGDVAPTLVCKIATGSEIADDIEPVFRAFEPLAEKTYEDKLDGKNSEDLDNGEGGGAGGGDGEDSGGACGSGGPDGAGCTYEVNVLYVTPDKVTTTKPEGATCNSGGPCNQGGDGRPCTGSQHTFCHTFGALFAAQMFKQQKEQEAEKLFNGCGYSTGVTAVLTVGSIKAFGGSGGGDAGECQDPSGEGDPDHPAADKGQTGRPRLGGGDPDTAPGISDL